MTSRPRGGASRRPCRVSERWTREKRHADCGHRRRKHGVCLRGKSGQGRGTGHADRRLGGARASDPGARPRNGRAPRGVHRNGGGDDRSGRGAQGGRRRDLRQHVQHARCGSSGRGRAQGFRVRPDPAERGGKCRDPDGGSRRRPRHGRPELPQRRPQGPGPGDAHEPGADVPGRTGPLAKPAPGWPSRISSRAPVWSPSSSRTSW